MSTSLLAFLTLVETCVRPRLTEEKSWRFQRLVNFKAHEGVLQLWDGDVLAGQTELRESGQGEGPPSFSGTVQSAGDTAAPRAFSFRAVNAAEVERQAQHVAELWRPAVPG